LRLLISSDQTCFDKTPGRMRHSGHAGKAM
jgi:hypothetical protein